jgi:hypothetical protein
MAMTRISDLYELIADRCVERVDHVEAERRPQVFGCDRAVLRALGLALLLALGFPARGSEDLPPASVVVARMIERARLVARETTGPLYTYEKRSVLEHLDAAGTSVGSEERLYQVTVIAGFPFNRLTRIQGRELSGEEQKREQRREERFQARFSSVNASNMVARKEAWLTPQLLDRFQFVVKERVTLNERPTLVMTFTPKAGPLPEKAVQDRFLNRMTGTLWLDERDAEAAKLSAHLTETVALGWFGLLGSLSQCELSLERQRMPEGVWVNAKQALRVQCRKLTSTIRVRTTEASSGFRTVGDAP